MAIFRLEVKVISRGKGQSAIACAAYRSGQKLADPMRVDKREHDYTRRDGVEHTMILVPANAPAWVRPPALADMIDQERVTDPKEAERHIRETLWQKAEAAERKSNAQLAREIILALPHEFERVPVSQENGKAITPEQRRIDLVTEFVERNFTSKGLIADVALHRPDDGRLNYHAHVMLTTRELDPVTGEFEKHKPRLPKEINPKSRSYWDQRELVPQWREDWAKTVNRHLERAGRSERVDHRSLAERDIEREPEPKIGPVKKNRPIDHRQELAREQWLQVRLRNLDREVTERAKDTLARHVEKAERAGHPLAQEAALDRLDQILGEIHMDGRGPKTGKEGRVSDSGPSVGNAAGKAQGGVSRAADSVLDVAGGVLGFLFGESAKTPQPVEERIRQLEAVRDRLAHEAQDHDRQQQREREEAERELEEERDRGRERERDRGK